jgi:two-component system nitrate/nitrite response regulator NarL
VAYGTAREYLERIKRKYTDAGRPTHTKLDLVERAREDRLELDRLGPGADRLDLGSTGSGTGQGLASA